MSAASQTKIFGIRLGVDPKLLIGGLVVLAAVLFWYNSSDTGGPEGASSGSTARTESPSAPVASASNRTRAARRKTQSVERSDLRIRDIDATHGDIDPTLRLDLIRRLQSVQLEPAKRSLFEIGPSSQQVAAGNVPAVPKGPKIPIDAPSTGHPVAAMPTGPVVNIPLKFYGFVKPATKGESNRGLFLDGDNILVASEGEILEQHYLVVELTPSSARMEDTSIKQGQTLPVVPEALQQ